jgi:hypothetical protein
MSTPATARPAAAAAVSISRDDAVMHAWTQAAEEMRRLETTAQTTFATYHTACERAADEGFVCALELSPGLAAFYSTFKQALARDQGREIAQHDHDEWAGGA